MNKLKILWVITLLTIIFGNSTYAQVMKSDTSNSTRVSVFNAPSNTYQFDDAGNEDYKYAVKINPLLILSGDIPFYFEYKLNKRLSAEVAVGPTIRNIWLEAFDESNFDNTPVNANKIGGSFRLGLRFYPSSTDEAIVGYYFEPELMFRKYYMGYQFFDYTTNPSTILDYVLRTNQTDFKMMFGYQDSFDSNLLIDYYVGFGLRTVNREDIDANSSSPTYLKVSAVDEVNPTFTLGLKLGFGF